MKKAPITEAPPLPFTEKRISGVEKGESHIAYAFSLPYMETEAFSETQAYLDELAEKYLSFLKKKSTEPCEKVRFGGLAFETRGQSVTLLAALSPFSERSFFPIAKLSFEKNGKLLAIHQISRKHCKEKSDQSADAL